MTTAVIKTGGKQYLVQEGSAIRIEKLAGAAGQQIKFKEVLLTADDKIVQLGRPIIKTAQVTAKIIEQGKLPKVTGVKMKAKKRNRHYFGHRQPFTKVEIQTITAS